VIDNIRCNTVNFELAGEVPFKDLGIGEFVYAFTTGAVGQKISETVMRFYSPTHAPSDTYVTFPRSDTYRRCSSVKIEVKK
jgi:hypothetical protein